MADQRVLLELGQGADLHGGDATKAACRAVRDAVGGASLPLFGALGVSPNAMRVVVTIGAPDSNAVDAVRVASVLPSGAVEVQIVPGGLTAGEALMAAAAVEVFLPLQEGWRLAPQTAAP
ncbi:MAG: Lin0512 family protein [Pseudomonadota bacterium]